MPERFRTPCCDRLVTVPRGANSVVCSECNRRVRLPDVEEDRSERRPRGAQDRRASSSDSSSLLLILLLVGGGLIVLFAVAGVGIYFLVSSVASAPPSAQQKDDILQPVAVTIDMGPAEFFGKSRTVLSARKANRAVLYRVGGIGLRSPRSAEVFDLGNGKSFGAKTLLDVESAPHEPMISVNPEGDRLVAREDRTLEEEEWNVRNRIFLYELPSGKRLIERWAIGRDVLLLSLLGRNKLLTAGPEKGVESWDLSTRTPTNLGSLPGREGPVVLSSDRRALAAWYGSGFDLIPVAAKGDRRRTDPLKAPKQPYAIAFSPKGERLAATFTTGNPLSYSVVCWDATTGRILSRGTAEKRSPTWWGERHLIIAGPLDGPGQLFDAEAGRALGSVRFWGKWFLPESPDGRLWLNEAKQMNITATVGLAAFDPPNAEVLAAIGPKAVLNLSTEGVRLTEW